MRTAVGTSPQLAAAQGALYGPQQTKGEGEDGHQGTAGSTGEMAKHPAGFVGIFAFAAPAHGLGLGPAPRPWDPAAGGLGHGPEY